MARRKQSAPGGTAGIKRATKEAEARKRETHTVQKRWFELEGEQAAQAASGAMQNWLALDVARQNDLALFARLYGSAQLNFSGTIQSRNVETGARGRIQNSLASTFNGVQSCTDTLTNTVCQHKPVVQFAATDGDWDSHKVARMRERFVAGWFYEQEVYKKTAIQARDSCVWGDGAIHVGRRDNRAVAERCFPGDLFVDPASCITNNRPPEMGRIHLVDRAEAFAMFDGDEAAQKKVANAPQVKLNVDSMFSDEADVIELIEMWRLPSFDDEGQPFGGHYLMCTQLDELQRKEWKRKTFPFAFIQWTPRLFGFWAQGLAEQLENLQLQYNELSYSINEAIELAGRFKLYSASTSNLVVDSIDNETGSILRGDGAPTSLLWQCVQPEVYLRLDKLEQQFYKQSGVAQMVASNEKPSPDESGIAIRERVGVYDERHALWTISYQDAHITLAKLAIEEITDILDEAGEDGSYTVYSVNGPKSDPIDFNDLRFEEGEQYVLTCMPVNDLPDTVEGRIALAQDFVQNGYYDEATARSVFLAPFDTRRVETLFNAARDYFSKVLDAIVEDNEDPPPPDGNDNLAMGLTMALQHLAYAKVREVSNARIDKLTNYITAIKAKLLEGAPTPPMPASDSAPTANPKAPPTSALLPTQSAAQAA